MQASHVKTGLIGEDGAIIAPLFSFGRVSLAPSFLTGDGSHMTLWFSVLLHVIAVGVNLTANIAFFVNSGDTAADILTGWAVVSVTAHTLGVLGTVLYTALVRDTWGKPLFSTLGIGLFLSALLATAKISYTHANAQAGSSVENVNFNLSLYAQAFGLASLIANSLCALSKSGL